MMAVGFLWYLWDVEFKRSKTSPVSSSSTAHSHNESHSEDSNRNPPPVEVSKPSKNQASKKGEKKSNMGSLKRSKPYAVSLEK
jgi:hypothetical protein